MARANHDYYIRRILVLALLGTLCVPGTTSAAQTLFVEAENFATTGDGWRVVRETSAVRSASGVATLWGADGNVEDTAFKQITINEAGTHRIWVRYRYHPRFLGPVRLSIFPSQGDPAGVLAEHVFHSAPIEGVDAWAYHWAHFEADLPAGEVRLELSKPDRRNSSNYVRHVDCLMITRDLQREPNHIDFGPRSYLRITLGEQYEQAVYLHLYADFFQRRQRGNFAMSRAGVTDRWPRPDDYLVAGEATPWMDVTSLLVNHGGARWNLAVKSRAGWNAPAPMQATFEFATEPEEGAIVHRIERDENAEHNTLHLRTPAYTTHANALAFKTDTEYAEATVKIADSMTWPTVGRFPERYPFFVSEHVTGGNLGRSARAVVEREQKTLDRFGFTDSNRRIGGGMWRFRHDQCYNQPDIDRMRSTVNQRAAHFAEQGGDIDEIVYAMLTDEPQGQRISHMVECESCAVAFRQWLRELGKTPGALECDSWKQVRPVTEDQHDQQPVLHYYTQRFRTRSLANYMAVQTELLHEAYGRDVPVNANISSGNAVFRANFYRQGVDYFELLGDGRLNALWSADWVNFASTYQMGAYNAALMRAAARRHEQHLGMYLIAYARRRPWDIKAKAVSQAARGIKALNSFYYGPFYSRNEGTPWIRRPEVWFDHAEVVREFGAAEHLLMDATPAPARTALLYASSSDIWTHARENYAWGFDRKHLWLALTHAQVDVDILGERDVADGWLEDYAVCYLTGPNLTAAAARALVDWVEAGGVLVLAAGAAQRDEYDRPLNVLEPALPADRGSLEVFQPHNNHGQGLRTLRVEDEVRAGEAVLDVLSMRQSLAPHAHGEVLGEFADGSPAMVRGAHGEGRVYVAGFLPGLAYIHPALTARREVDQRRQAREAELDDAIRDADDDAERGAVDEAMDESLEVPNPDVVAESMQLIERSYNPWAYPDAVRHRIVEPVRHAGVTPWIECDVPLVDAVLMESDAGAAVPLANWTLQPQQRITLRVRTNQPVRRVESVHHGELAFVGRGSRDVRFSLPLRQTDFVKVYYENARDE